MRWRRVTTVLLALAVARAAHGEDDPLAPLLKQLAAGETKARTTAARLLGRVTDVAQRERAAAALTAVLADEDEDVRVTAAVALARLDAADGKAVRVLADALGSPDWYTRWQACVALGTLGPAAVSAIPPLTNAAFDPELDLAWEAAIALVRIGKGDRVAQEALARLVASDRVLDRALLLKTLAEASRVDLVGDWLATEIAANEHELRDVAYKLLVESGEGGVEFFGDVLEAPDPRARVLALEGLTALKATGAGAAIRKLAADPDRDVRRAAIRTIGALKIQSAAPNVAAALEDPDPDVQAEAVTTLTNLGIMVPEAAPALVRRILHCPSSSDVAALPRAKEVRVLQAEPSRAYEALRVVAPAVGDWIRLDRELVQRQGGPVEARFVARLRVPGEGHEGDVDVLLAALEDNRTGADLAAALRAVLRPGRDDVLIRLLAAGDPGARRDAALLLGYLAADGKAATRALEPLRRDPREDIAAAAKRALELLERR